MWLPTFPSRFAAALALAALAAPVMFAQTARADSYDDDNGYDTSASRVGRVSRLDGEASLRQTGSDEWQDVGQNTPVFQGDEFYTDRDSRMEFQLGGGRYVRIDESTDVYFASLDDDAVRVEVPAGSVIVSLRHLDGHDSFEVSAPAAAVTLRDDGTYRIDVDDDGNTRVSVLDGSARASGTERTVDLDEGESARFDYYNGDDVDVSSYRGYDDFDSWSGDLDQRYDDYYARSDRYVDQLGYRNDIYGLAELIGYGSWFNTGTYGYCWVPSVGYGWQPYSNGYWQWYPGYGYTWVSNDPWGWAPFHYGRWEYLNGYGWAWIPWSQYSYGNYYWTPAQVYWYQPYQNPHSYAYVPLAPNEPYIDYRRFDRRHQRDFVPRHLNAGRGIGVVEPGSGARLKPVAGGRGVIDRGTGGGRAPVAVNPERPKDMTPVKARFKPALSETVLTRPVVVDNPVTTTTKPSRGPVVERRPTRQAAGDSDGAVVVKPARKPKVEDDTPTMVETRPVPRREHKPVITPDGGETPTRVKPGRPKVDDGNSQPVERTERPKPRRVEPVGPANDGGSVDRPRADREPKADRQPKVDREPKVEREPRPEAPRHEAPPPERPKQDRQPQQERPAWFEHVERTAPPPRAPRVERNNDSNSGGGKHNRPN
jgi:hypothetical protein